MPVGSRDTCMLLRAADSFRLQVSCDLASQGLWRQVLLSPCRILPLKTQLLGFPFLWGGPSSTTYLTPQETPQAPQV